MFKRIFCLVVSFVLIQASFFCGAESIDVSAKSAVLMNAETNTVYYGKNMSQRLSMASTTKIMTAVVLCENKRLDEAVSVTYEMIAVEGTSMGLRENDKVSYYTLLCGLLLSSGNDAANAIALSVSKTQKRFAVLMNKKAEEIGMKNTNFVTPSGLDDEKHYTTAYDMALLASYALKNQVIKDIVSQKKIKVTFLKPKKEVTLFNHNKLLTLYENAIGIKTGFTKKSGRCLVSAAKKKNDTLIAVTLNAPNDWNDHINLFEYGFRKFKPLCVSDLVDLESVSIAGGNSARLDIEKKTVNITDLDKKNITYKIFIPPFLYREHQTRKIGEVKYYCKDRYLTSSDIYLKEVSNEISKRDFSFEFIYNFKKLLQI